MAEPQKSPARTVAGAVAGFAVTWAGNFLCTIWVKPDVFMSNAICDAWSAMATLLIPALLGGTVIAFIARETAAPAAACAYALFAVIGILHPFWHIPRVSAELAHNAVMHYFLYSPLVTLPFGMLAAWFVGQFTTGKWRLDDDKPVRPAGE